VGRAGYWTPAGAVTSLVHTISVGVSQLAWMMEHVVKNSLLSGQETTGATFEIEVIPQR
jgi:hypothetical protein